MPFAFSVHNFISSVGADAGFAAIIGLAVLVLLYFAHARETANLREEAALLAARLQQAEARVAELSRPQPVRTAVPAAEGVQVTDQRLAAAPFAPAGLGAPALAAATRVVPLPSSPAPEAAPADSEPAVAVAAASAGPAVVAAASALPSAAPPAVPSAAPPALPSAGAPPVPPPRAAGAAIPAASGTTAGAAVPGPATAAGANGGGRGSAVPVQPGPSRDTTGQPGRLPPRPLPPLGPPADGRSSVGRRVIVGLAALLLVGVAVVALVVLTNNNGSTNTSAGSARNTNAPATRRLAAFSPSTVTVAVLNGTATNQLAHHVAAKLGGDGYKTGRVATAANQTETTTVVAYLPGAKNKADALHVATALKLRPTSVQPIDQATQQVACPGPGACNANVVVTVGADLATL